MAFGQELSYAVRLPVVGRYFGQFCLLVAALSLPPLLVALFSGEAAVALRYLLVMTALAGFGGLLVRLPRPEHVQMNEALTLAALVFLAIPLVMTIPMQASGMRFVDALFETVSAATTTGLSTLATVEGKSRTFLFARAWMQWYGGLGIVVLSLALVIRPGLTAKRLLTTGPAEEDLVGGTRAHARRVLVVYLILTLAGLLLWVLLGGRPGEGLLYMMAAVSTGGFAPADGSFADLGGWRLAWVASLACFAGALPLALYHTAWRQGWRCWVGDLQVRAMAVAAVLTCLAVALCLFLVGGMEWRQVLVHAPLMAISAQTTAGFSSMPPDQMDAAAKLVMIVVMAIGGGTGSTAGGFKLFRLLILLGLLRRFFLTSNTPQHTYLPARFGGRKIADAEIEDALMVILVYFGVIILSWLPFLAYGHQPLDALFEVVSAIGTVGLSAGISG
ncbi:MAG: TrkH family potassium uptake protein, partial [Desulfuromonadales bacterium]|nr:TrkH family potassium uptake protein [Desulfuromonadales bacterium]NIR33790.1 TrkH family potassium uptake protein [Desulfuromonadales bacterium]NIS41368.1 TrkH family potassium uptake protein [Desulfuromonadales bacterium]